MTKRQIIEADLTWTGSTFEPGVRIVIHGDRIERVGVEAPPTRRLESAALIPGFVNAHSHAFQRGLRGRGESFPDGAGSFWSWREAMYELVGSLDADGAYELSKAAFEEMLAAGITTVGEFHYLHHAPDRHDFSLDEVILRSASDAGIRIALLYAYYNTGDIGRPLDGAQRRFAVADPDEFWRRIDGLERLLDPSTQSLGAVVHSIRASTLDDLVSLHRESCARDMVFHMHVEEQQREIDACIDAYGARPMQLLCDRLAIDDRFTAVHCTHTDPGDLARFARAGANVCICPLTEANLADGVADIPSVRAAGGALCIGTDSNARISFTEELRWLEYVQRLSRQRRGVVVDEAGSVARALMEIGAAGGARALGVDAGAIQPGGLADLAAVDLNHPSLRGFDPDSLLDSLLLGGADSAIDEVCVGGRWRRPVR